MQFEKFRAYCLDKPGAHEEQPLGNDSFYYKLGDMVFAIADKGEEYRLTLKCDPQQAIDLRNTHACVKPGYHINKEHWNTFLMEAVEELPLSPWIDQAYDLTLSKLSKKKRERLGLSA
ncbi:Predicted DNA-binding protein, MmcQ/YjbR family [Catalinimonas alkaloidigena]|uniref:Predicted DNA-binding protein, MmcQ/YjbR family n=1 Tax=Catalinimonas alkaloidigena TaxID=1075417 RepID=A0A1G9EJJ6_9BACT|nr:MmcQ/YjbR family DNA-binding protein [Catalinimonas alkaloidigena]SDK76205.1 Predicted DNA-binding protein, MmcQ/YjbR family [Catalinimonas alkaloidigena]